ncbi:unnamed protein product [Penicillium roqueforti FM164]|uniref:Genomic scaffold, ProqFM164S01 n=1 Tax=Penicillium roqueforti (strain FM164) TaxID=1365484 RepID=W6PVJ2_PENRF|nr:unnamed protein product [Penicillium roqueforti FM164]
MIGQVYRNAKRPSLPSTLYSSPDKRTNHTNHQSSSDSMKVVVRFKLAAIPIVGTYVTRQ